MFFVNSCRLTKKSGRLLSIIDCVMNKDNMKKVARRTTVQRMVVFEELRKVLNHPTADELYARVRGRLPGISLSTIYRNLEILCEEGLARKIQFSEGQTRYDATLSIHHHIRCTKCGRVDEIKFEKTAHVMEFVNKKSDYEVLDCKFEFIGICAKCQKNGETNEGKTSLEELPELKPAKAENT